MRKEPDPRHIVNTGRLHEGIKGTMDAFLRAAIEEARQGLFEGGIPIGSVLVIDGGIVVFGGQGTRPTYSQDIYRYTPPS